MKTIFDKVDPVYLDHAARGVECATGTCGHTTHQFSGAMLVISIVTVAMICFTVSRTSQ